MKERELSFSHNENKTIVKLSPDNHALVEKHYGEAWFSLKELLERYNKGELEEGFKETLLSVSESHIMDLLKAFGHEGAIQKETEKRHSEIRSLHQENRDLRKQLGGKVSSEDAREKLKNLSAIIREWWRKEGFGHVSEIKYGEYGSCEVKLSCMMSGDFRILDDETPVSGKEKKKDWIQELIDRGYKILPEEGGYDWKVIDNDKNRELVISDIKNRFPTSSIISIENWHGRHREPTMRDVVFHIRNLDEI